MEPATAVASRAGAGEATAGFGCTGTGTTSTVDGADGGAAGVSVGAPGPAASAVETPRRTKVVRRAERVFAQRALVFIESVRPCIR
jgi:hypothetical protein